jgi:hypothetical protein
MGRSQDFDRQLSRRKIFKGIAGAAAVGAGGLALVESASPAAAAPLATTTESGAVAPAVVNLTDGATVSVDASLGNDFRLTINGNRTMGTPANPTDGEQITFQVTQGASAPFTLAWGSGYQFSSTVPQPTLSAKAGQTDLIAFVYNASRAEWLCFAFSGGFAAVSDPTPPTTPPTTPAPPTTPPPTTPPPTAGTYRLFSSVSGPAAATSYSGPFVSGVVFAVTSGGCWFDGYWWWVCNSGAPTAAQPFTLWCMYAGPDSGSLVPGTSVTSGTLTAGQWNYVALPKPVPLAIGATYVAATGFTGGFPDTGSEFGSGDPYQNGIVSGPLTAYSDSSGSLPSPFRTAQSVFSDSTSSPTATMPIYGYQTANFWTDLQVTTNPPAGTSYRLWPGYPTLAGGLSSDETGYTLATEFRLTESCTLDNIWYYSAAGASALPTRCAIWNVSSQSEVSGTDRTSPAWSGAAGSGWVASAYGGVTLPAGDYKVAVFYAGGSQWYQVTTGYWTTGGTGAGGITSGPLTAPGSSAATSPGQGTYNLSVWGYPDTFATGGNGENYWADVEVTPVG